MMQQPARSMYELEEPYDVSRIAPKLWQGAEPPRGPYLKAHGADVLILCAKELQLPAAFFPGVEVFHAPLEDKPRAPNSEEIAIASAAARFVVANLRAGKRVLVTCQMGLNRSGLVSALALRELTGTSGLACLQHVRAQRPNALFNNHFGAFLAALPARRR
jgi:protein-tyrosine phosphatase